MIGIVNDVKLTNVHNIIIRSKDTNGDDARCSTERNGFFNCHKLRFKRSTCKFRCCRDFHCVTRALAISVLPIKHCHFIPPLLHASPCPKTIGLPPTQNDNPKSHRRRYRGQIDVCVGLWHFSAHQRLFFEA